MRERLTQMLALSLVVSFKIIAATPLRQMVCRATNLNQRCFADPVFPDLREQKLAERRRGGLAGYVLEANLTARLRGQNGFPHNRLVSLWSPFSANRRSCRPHHCN